MAQTIGEMIGNHQSLYKTMLENLSNNLRVAIPGIVQSFDAETQTATVQVAIREKINNMDLTQEWMNIPPLLDVPVVLPRAGGFVLTMPVQQGDECLIIFNDMCYDAWWSNGGIQNQLEKRRHDLSDAVAVMGLWSQPNVISNYSATSAQLRSLDGLTSISLSKGEIDINAASVKINGGSGEIDLNATNVNANGTSLTAPDTDPVDNDPTDTDNYVTQTPPSWTLATILSPWYNFDSTRTLRYRLLGNYSVQLVGTVGGGSNAQPTTAICQLPVGYRPSFNVVWLASCYTSSGSGICELTCDSSGNVTVSNWHGNYANWVHIYFSIPLI